MSKNMLLKMQEYENMHNYEHRQLHLPITFPYVVGRARPKAGEQFCGRARPKAGENAAKPQQKSGGWGRLGVLMSFQTFFCNFDWNYFFSYIASLIFFVYTIYLFFCLIIICLSQYDHMDGVVCDLYVFIYIISVAIKLHKNHTFFKCFFVFLFLKLVWKYIYFRNKKKTMSVFFYFLY